MEGKQIALVTGANKGIGLQIAKELSAHGLIVLIGSRDFAAGEAAAGAVGPDARAIQLDVTDQGSVAAAAERIGTEFGQLDVLVNNAGVSHAAAAATPFEAVMKSNPLTVATLSDVRAVWADGPTGTSSDENGLVAW